MACRFSELLLSVRCHGCGAETEKTVRWLRDHAGFACWTCREWVLVHDREARIALDEIEVRLAGLYR